MHRLDELRVLERSLRIRAGDVGQEARPLRRGGGGR